MTTQLMSLENAPSEKELIALLGSDVYMNYRTVLESITSTLCPEVELWDQAGRRGKYLHGFRVNSPKLLIDIFLDRISEAGLVKCQFSLMKRSFAKIRSRINEFNEHTKRSILSCARNNEEFGGYYLELFIDDETMPDIEIIISSLAPSQSKDISEVND